MTNPEYAFNIYYSEEPNNGATYLHTTLNKAKEELVSVYEDIIETAKNERMDFRSLEFDDETGCFAEVVLYDRIYDMEYTRILTINRIYE